ncbi:single-stranded-DNA-specific exonuclease RecJ [Cyanobium gracile UHCC 0139]|uniref:Single-stranded-DNA-specific exonuclease RecJ n=1 Tax=Cyanobium gracile UHCC 0139 TaxID=3110308 RepID=A0ABU5RSF1_9CYAN|nr:single-stranded-DNA-specific exonuclease RecJ [Cyanobium gracile]MEA5390734.1 single-stranded-DNA-specific exonuclease RecJ [Cyanobium gracile UHCC 0139]
MLSAVDERRWLLPTPLGADGPAEAAGAADADLPCELLALLRRRGLVTAEAVRRLLDPEAAPDPEAHFPALALAIERLVRCCQGAEAVAICGDYDADGMTSTALLVGVLQRLGARPQAAIPSRMDDGYGLNAAMVERLAAEGVRLLITVDNGVAAIEALERAAALEVEVILTDHHTLPPQLPPHLALLHPAVTPEDSPYRGLAGVGLAHVLATALCRRLRHRHGLEIALNLFCIGTIADMAPLEGVNRRWLLDGLPLLGRSPLPGLQALQQLAGLEKHRVDAEAVGFQLAPRINAVGRLGDPQLVVDLLTTEDPERALELARSCEALNRQRRELCSAIEAEALALLEADGPRRPAFLLLAQGHWHHGVIGIVASRLVERFGRPVALLAGEGGGRLRASVRAPKGFAVDGALTACADLLERHGGHPAAGGFTVRAENVGVLQERLDALASHWLEAAGEGRTVEPEALLRLERIDREFWRQLQRLAPFGIGHPTPLFWSSRCQVVEQKLLRGGHLQLQLAQGEARLRAIGWRWQGPHQWAGPVDVAYRLRRDDWQGVERFQLELEAIRCSGGDTVVLQRRNRTYWCRRQGDSLVIRNAAGEELRSAIPPDGTGPAALVDPPHPYVQGLMREAAMALGMVEG